jgi:hypothetical protein
MDKDNDKKDKDKKDKDKDKADNKPATILRPGQVEIVDARHQELPVLVFEGDL